MDDATLWICSDRHVAAHRDDATLWICSDVSVVIEAVGHCRHKEWWQELLKKNYI